MKKTIYLIYFLLISLVSYSQVCLTTCKDESGYYSYFNYNLPIDSGKYHVLFTINLNSKNGIASYESIFVETNGFKTCCNGFKVIMVFDNGCYEVFNSYDTHYCKTDFKIAKNTLFNDNLEKISNCKLDRIFIVSLNYFEVVEFKVTDEYKTYFIEVQKILLNEKK